MDPQELSETEIEMYEEEDEAKYAEEEDELPDLLSESELEEEEEEDPEFLLYTSGSEEDAQNYEIRQEDLDFVEDNTNGEYWESIEKEVAEKQKKLLRKKN